MKGYHHPGRMLLDCEGKDDQHILGQLEVKEVEENYTGPMNGFMESRVSI